jgi:hypothetical protein
MHLWRFKEIFIDKRHQFHKTKTMPLVYNEYKRKSTLYRVASVLGWLRAINLELSALPRGTSGFLVPISEAIGKFHSALADGPHVELHRLKQICAVWKLDIGSMNNEKRTSLATRLEIELYRLAGDRLKEDNYLGELDPEEKFQLCQGLSTFLCRELHRKSLEHDVIKQTTALVATALSYREALIYRDWQDAIGDSMLELDQDSEVRRYKIIGYEKFEEVLKADTLWMKVFRTSIDDIDFEEIDPNDFRLRQLESVARAVADIVIGLSGSEEHDLVQEPVRQVALAMPQPATTSI